MGLLDEAIREHLELKRRRGADPAEIARQEREALGPGRAAGDSAGVVTQQPAAPAAGEWDEETHEPAVASPGFDEGEEPGEDTDSDEAEELDELDEPEDVAEPPPPAPEPPTRVSATPPPPPP